MLYLSGEREKKVITNEKVLLEKKMLERRKIKNKLEISSFIKIHSVLRKNKKKWFIHDGSIAACIKLFAREKVNKERKRRRRRI